jgi:Domain of unknown function (DUF4375)
MNATGALIGEAIAGAERTGLHTHSAILREAANVFPGGKVPEDFDERNDVWDSIPERKLEDELNPLDDRWYAAETSSYPDSSDTCCVITRKSSSASPAPV